MHIHIETLTDKHYANWLVLWRAYLKFYQTSLGEDVINDVWKRICDPSSELCGFAALHDGEMVGFVHYLFHPVTWSKGPRCYLEDLFTSENARGCGVGRALIHAVRDVAKIQGADQVYWLTERDNAQAQILYDKVATKTPFIKYAKILS